MSLLYQVFGTGICAYICLCMGLMFTWPSHTYVLFESNTTTLHRPMTKTELSLFGSLSSIGALISTPFMGYLLDNIGRKFSLMAFFMSNVIAWSLLAACNRVELVLFAMFVTGLGGASFLVITMYITEICQQNIRGTMSTGAMIFYGVGMLLSYLLGGILEYKVMIYICLTATVAGELLLWVLKESPTYLMQKGLEEEAARSIAFYHNARPDSKQVLYEMDVIRRALDPTLCEVPLQDVSHSGLKPEEEKLNPDVKTREKLSLWKFVKQSRSTRRAMLVCLVLVTTSIFQGMAVVQVYAITLFKKAVPIISPTLGSVLMSVVGVLAGFLAAYLTDTAGRRVLMIYSSFLGGICCVILGTQLQLQWAPHWMTATCIYLFCVAYTCGAGTVPFLFIAEVFLPEVKSFMQMFASEWIWLCNFFVLFIFNHLVSAMGLGAVFYIFSTVCFLSSAFCYYFQPETKGLPVDAIQLLFAPTR